MVVGIDPGTTVAYAIFDLNGKLIHANSERELSKEQLVQRISKFGKPCLITCDVLLAQDLVLRLATIFNTRIFTPNYNLTEDEKKLLTKSYKFSNEHERDAIASVVKTFHFYENRFRQVEKIAREKKLDSKINELKYLMLSGVSLNNALLMFEEPEELKIQMAERQVLRPSKPIEISQMLQANMELKKAVERLERENLLLKEQLKSSESEANLRLRNDKVVRALELKIRKLEELLKRKKQARQVVLKMITPNNKEPNIEDLITNYREQRSSD